jgi:hypothetical protein
MQLSHKKHNQAARELASKKCRSNTVIQLGRLPILISRTSLQINHQAWLLPLCPSNL